MKIRIALAAIAAVAPHVAAQTGPRPNPTDPAIAVPAARYESALTGYRASREEPLAPWRAVNDEVARVGGHIGVLKAGSGAGSAAPPGGPAAPRAGARTSGKEGAAR